MSSATRPSRLLLARPRGYCAGVERAVEAVEQMLALHGPPIYVRKQIVHNIHVVRRLEQQGAIFVESEEDVPEGATIVLSAHGVAPEVHRNAALRRLRAIDATCPLVTKVHNEARRFAGQGYTIFLIGHAGHEEVVGTMGEAPDEIVLVQTLEDVALLPEPRTEKLAYITQTTLSVDETTDIIAALQRALPDDRRAAQGRHLLRDDQPPGGRQVARARGRPRARDRLGELVQLAAPGRRDARPRRAGAPRSTTSRRSSTAGSTASRPSASRPAPRRPSGSSSASSTGSASAASSRSPSTT